MQVFVGIVELYVLWFFSFPLVNDAVNKIVYAWMNIKMIVFINTDQWKRFVNFFLLYIDIDSH